MNDIEAKEKNSWQSNEERWLNLWQENDVYKSTKDETKQKRYVLVEFPYPSGSGLHIGHTFTMTGADVYARKKRMEGENVLFPMGWDAFGLPTENYAIKKGKKPQKVTEKNTDNFRRQMKRLAFSFDWSREINTTDPAYYHWTQWIFLQLFKHGLAYKEEKPINWCPSCKIGLANEEVIDGKCERCGETVSRRKISQWVVKITDYADRLLSGLEKTEFVEKVKAAQTNWIGKSTGAKVRFPLEEGILKPRRAEKAQAGRQVQDDGLEDIEVFTTRPDTLWGATFMVLAPEHKLVQAMQKPKSKIQKEISKAKISEIKEYVKQAKKKSDLQRTELEKNKTGVFTGLYAQNPVNGKKIPIWISDFVLATYGTGAIMAVPAHDERDWQFARKYDLPIIPVVEPKEEWDFAKAVYTDVEEGKMINSGSLNGLNPQKAIEKVTEILQEKGQGQTAVNYHLRDWIFSRQHYWGEPIPMIFCEDCSQNIELKNDNFSKKLAKFAEKKGIDVEVLLNNPGWFPVSKEQLPIRLPEVENYQPTDTGESPLAKMSGWKKTKCPLCGGEAVRETDTMPNWAGSDWYFLSYCFAKQLDASARKEWKKNIFEENKALLQYWLPVDVYIGGDEHNTLHLLYSRFIYQFLHDIGVVPEEYPEPYFKRISHGVILGPDGQRMSKSQGNVVNPDEKWQEYGVDALRLYLMFMGPFSATMAWDENALQGTSRFLGRFRRLIQKKMQQPASPKRETRVLLNRLIKKVSEDINNFHYNTAIAALMKFCNEVEDRRLDEESLQILVKLLAPFAPFLCEELWQDLGQDFSVHQQPWPDYKKDLLETKESTIIVQVNGRLRGKIDIESDRLNDKEWVIKQAKQIEKVEKYLKGGEVKKTIFVPKKLVNFVI